MFFKRKQYDPKAPKIGAINSFDVIRLHLSGMRSVVDIEITSNGAESTICQYRFVYRPGGHDRIPDVTVIRPTDEVLSVLNSCEFGKWSGFHGPHPPGLLDGTMFDLTATVNGGVELRADGSENFPPNFRQFEDYLYEKLREGETEKNE